VCFYCDAAPAVHIDHFIPIARWNEVQLTAQQRADGPNHISNLVGACAPCNLSKGARLPDVEWRGRESKT
jgi:5-methylcytosine-specific restriction endonuclease McrA